jgi:hypothetical protein
MEYVRGSQQDKWHWCKNCTQYPMYIYQKINMEPPSNLCDQCKTRTENETCVSEELNKKDPEYGIKTDFPTFVYNS